MRAGRLLRQQRRVKELTGGDGVHSVLECVALDQAVATAIEIARPDVLEGRIDPGRVFDRVVGIEQVPDGYRAMNDREAIKVMVNPS